MIIWAMIIVGGLLSLQTAFADGAKLFADFCQNCHGANAEGLQTFSGSLDHFREILEGNTENMPDFYDVFPAEDINELYQYVISPTN